MARIAGRGSSFVTQKFEIDSGDASIEQALSQEQRQNWDWTLVDLETMSAQSMGLPLSDRTIPPFVLNEDTFAFQLEDIQAGTSKLYIVEGDEARESISVSGEILQLTRLR